MTILNPRCHGTESSLAECVYTISQNACSRSQHDIVGIQCIQGKKVKQSWKLSMHCNVHAQILSKMASYV